MGERFFNSYKEIVGIKAEDYARAVCYINALKATARIAYESIYVIDFKARRFLYVSPNPMFLGDYKPEEVEELGYEFYTKMVPKEEIDLILEVEEVSHQFLHRQPIEERPLLTLSYDFHINNCGHIQLINHRMTPLIVADNGEVWLTLCYVSMSNNNKPGNVMIRKQGESGYWIYNLESKRWIKHPDIVLSEAEKEVLLMSARGLTIDQIADTTKRAKDTIKSRRRSLFEKLGVKSITEALAFAVNHKLI